MIAYSGEKDNSYASDNNYFVEIRDIDDNGMMGEGRPVTVDFMNELVRGYSESHSTNTRQIIDSTAMLIKAAEAEIKRLTNETEDTDS